MRHHLEVCDDADAAATTAALLIARCAERAVTDHGTFTFAVSGGRTPWVMLKALSDLRMPWPRMRIFQVDERIAPDGDPDRNLTQLRRSLDEHDVLLEPMPVELPDLESAAASYAAALPTQLDLVHLGLGTDGHTASLVPDDPVLAVQDRDVAVTSTSYQGRRRMTLTYPGLARARELVWLVAGADKRDALSRLLAGDDTIPAGKVAAARSVVMADRAAAGDLRSEDPR